jgi:superfamily II DNA or RNA helicase
MTAHYDAAGQKAGLIVVPTGGGKTVLAAHWLLEHHVRNGGRVLWLAHRRSLLRQAMETFRRYGNVAFPKSDLHLATVSSEDVHWPSISTEHDVVFSSMQTAVLELNKGFVHEYLYERDRPAFVVVDEAHHAPAPSYARLLREVKDGGCKLLGLTATPVRMNDADQQRLSSLFDHHVISQVSRRELTEKDILARPAFQTVKTEVNLEKDFSAEDLSYLERFGEIGPSVLRRLAKHAHRNALIVDHYVKNKDTFGPTIVFAGDTLHAQTLADEFVKHGVAADAVDYSRKDAHQIIERYRTEKKPDVLVNVEMLTEGFDAPHTRTVFIARPTRSEGLLAQMVGRALRGKQSGGNDTAYLVTFLDTWEQFNVLDAEYVLAEGIDGPQMEPGRPETQPIPIPLELVREANRLLQSNVRGQLTGLFQCLPFGWYSWTEAFEDDEQQRSVMVFDNQTTEYEAMLAAFPTPESVPAEITEDLARSIVQRFFADVPDPLPRWADVKALLDAKRKGCEIELFTFEQKRAFDPSTLASKILADSMTRQQEVAFVQGIWDQQAACRAVYRDDLRSFMEDVTCELLERTTPANPPLPPEIQQLVPTAAPRAWPDGQGYSLVRLRDSAFSVKRHFPKGLPFVADLCWSKAPIWPWGYYRDSDKNITINCVLDSPDIPYFVLEYLMFHELLHADMPGAAHNRDYRERERGYTPSVEALEDAERRGIRPGPKAGPTFWYVTADRFLSTFHRQFLKRRPGYVAEMW